jgi:membrane protein YdbS with pleckstrin-like domain
MSHPPEPAETSPDPPEAAPPEAAPPEAAPPEPAAPTPEPALPSWVAAGSERPLAAAWITVARINGLIWAAIFTGIAAVGLTFAVIASDTLTLAGGGIALFAIGAAFALRAYLWPTVAYRHSSYRFAEEGLQLRRGVVWRSQVAVARSRIQHTDVSQGPIERIYGLATLTVHTAGNHYAAIGLPGLEYADALAARDFLLAARAADAGDAV